LAAVRREMRPFVPAGPAGAPASWIEIDLPALDLATEGEWSVRVAGTPELEPGRNLVACTLDGGGRTERFSVVVDLHVYAEIATARRDLGRETVLDAAAFDWTWRDLAEVQPGRVTGRGQLAGASLLRDLKSGDELRESDLAPTPVVRAGEAVDLTIRRGGVVVTVRAVARQPGCAGQTIPVRNEITGRLVNALVAGPGRVEWRR
jgi:flagella basal body P-ring formation protein FlgA